MWQVVFIYTLYCTGAVHIALDIVAGVADFLGEGERIMRRKVAVTVVRMLVFCVEIGVYSAAPAGARAATTSLASACALYLVVGALKTGAYRRRVNRYVPYIVAGAASAASLHGRLSALKHLV